MCDQSAKRKSWLCSQMGLGSILSPLLSHCLVLAKSSVLPDAQPINKSRVRTTLRVPGEKGGGCPSRHHPDLASVHILSSVPGPAPPHSGSVWREAKFA